jgi:hypothetical protein
MGSGGAEASYRRGAGTSSGRTLDCPLDLAARFAPQRPRVGTSSGLLPVSGKIRSEKDSFFYFNSTSRIISSFSDVVANPLLLGVQRRFK